MPLLTATSAWLTLRAAFLLLNGGEIEAAIDEQERLMLELASGRLSRAELTDWLEQHVSRPPDQAV